MSRYRCLVTACVLWGSACLAQAQSPEPFEQARLLLQQGKVSEAAAIVEKWSHDEPQRRVAWQLRAAASTALGGTTPDAVTRALAERAPAVKAPMIGMLNYVSAMSLRIRARPDTSAAVLSQLLINTQVAVKGVKGDWAQVISTSGPAAMVTLSFDGGPSAAPAVVEGYVLWRFLRPMVVTRESLQSEARAWELYGDYGEAASVLERVLALDPNERELRFEVARLAWQAKLWDLAFRVVAPIELAAGDAELGVGSALEVLTVGTSVFGCRGQRRGAVMLEADATGKALAKGLPGACVTTVDTAGECAPPEPYAGGPFGAEQACDAEYRGTDSLATCKQQVASKLKQYERDLAVWRQGASRFNERLVTLRTSFPDGPYVRFAVKGQLTGADARGLRLFAYELPYTVWSCQDSGTSVLWKQLRVSSASTPAPMPGTESDVWVKASKPASVIVGLVAASSADNARQRVLGGHTEEQSNFGSPDPEPIGPKPKVALPSPLCQCGAEPAVSW